MRVVWYGQVVAESDDIYVDGSDYYFPRESIEHEFFMKSKAVFHCADKGYADQYNLTVRGNTVENAAWMYPHPYPDAKQLKNMVGFKRTFVETHS
jgi:uncharacterized protein (DUF427 family)